VSPASWLNWIFNLSYNIRRVDKIEFFPHKVDLNFQGSKNVSVTEVYKILALCCMSTRCEWNLEWIKFIRRYVSVSFSFPRSLDWYLSRGGKRSGLRLNNKSWLVATNYMSQHEMLNSCFTDYNFSLWKTVLHSYLTLNVWRETDVCPNGNCVCIWLIVSRAGSGTRLLSILSEASRYLACWTAI